MWGADVAQLRTLAQQFGKVSDDLMQTSLHLTNQINSNPSWKGNDATKFRSDWNGNHRALIQRTVRVLKDESRKLLDNANEQEKASDAAPGSGGGPIPGGTSSGQPGSRSASGRPGDEFWGPDWLADSENSPFRGGWETYNMIKAFPSLRSGLFDMAAMLHKSRIGDYFDAGAWKAFQTTNQFSGFFNVSNQLFEGNWHEAFDLTEGTKAFRAFEGLGRGLGVLGVGLDTLDAINSAREGDFGATAYSAAKAFAGVASFLPPPVGTVFMVASAGSALYDNVPMVRDSLNWVGGKIGDGAKAAGDVISDGAEAVSDTISDGAEAVGDFFGF
ncbi:hypothetical protein J7I85_03635 [Arthrobacter sp. ISL-65]|nr:hypothetical protein [Arthrobacter sp. ISL-65]